MELIRTERKEQTVNLSEAMKKIMSFTLITIQLSKYNDNVKGKNIITI